MTTVDEAWVLRQMNNGIHNGFSGIFRLSFKLRTQIPKHYHWHSGEQKDITGYSDTERHVFKVDLYIL